MDTFSLEFLQQFFSGAFWTVTVESFLKWFSVSFVAVLFTHALLRRSRSRWSSEAILRLSFLIVPIVFLTTLLAVNRPIFPIATYAIVSGSFVGALWKTQQMFGLVEGNAEPSESEVSEVLEYHEGLKIHPLPWWKFILDRVIGVLLFILLSPIFLALAIAVWVNDPGPMILAKHTVGRGGRPFREYKLRSMIKQAEKHTGAIQSHHQDPRVLWIGRFLRRSHFDEFPQMWNVIKGEMSLVGPRPEKVVRVKNFLHDVPNYPERHLVLPGITGWAQIHHTYYTPPAEKLVYDQYYIQHQSFFFDLRILWRTLTLSASDATQGASPFSPPPPST